MSEASVSSTLHIDQVIKVREEPLTLISHHLSEKHSVSVGGGVAKFVVEREGYFEKCNERCSVIVKLLGPRLHARG